MGHLDRGEGNECGDPPIPHPSKHEGQGAKVDKQGVGFDSLVELELGFWRVPSPSLPRREDSERPGNQE